MGKSLKGARVSFGAVDVHRVIPARLLSVERVRERLEAFKGNASYEDLKKEMLDLCKDAEEKGELHVRLHAGHHAALDSATESSTDGGGTPAGSGIAKHQTRIAPGSKRFADLVFTNDTATPMQPVRFRLRKHGGSFPDEGWIECDSLIAPSTTWHGVAPDQVSDDIVEIQVEFAMGEPGMFVWNWLIEDVSFFRLHQVHLIIRGEGDEVGYDGHVVLWDLTMEDQTVTVPLLD